MLTPDDINYAMENTRVILPPKQRLATFGTSLINYYLITEDMDAVNLTHVREGQIHAERPEIMTPEYFSRLLLEGFGERAQEFANFLSAHSNQFSFLKYGFRFRKSDMRSYEAHLPMAEVSEKVKIDVAAKNDPLSAVVTGIDDGWEVCLVKFMADLIQSSSGKNVDDFRKRGLL
jgi:hypothetical protein